MNPKRLPVPVGPYRLFGKTIKACYPLLSPLARVRRSRLPAESAIIAVVGSFGKSTTTRLVRAMLGLEDSLRATKNNGSAAALAILRLNREQRIEVLEVEINGPGQMESHARMVSPTAVIVTCIGSEHNRSLKNLETTRHEKAFMVRALPEDGTAILNGDDPHVTWMATQTRAAIRTFGFGAGNDVRILDSEIDWPNGMRIRLETRGEKHEFVTRLLGRPGSYAVAAAVAAADLLNVPIETVKRRVTDFEPTPGRLEKVHLKDQVYFLRDDFKSGSETIFESLEVLKSIDVAEKLVVLGEETESDMSLHELYRRIGVEIGAMGARTVFWGSSVRYRDLKRGFAQGGGLVEHLHRATSFQETVRLAKEEVGSEQVILVKGRIRQRMGRVVLALQEGRIRCSLDDCKLKIECSACPRWFASKRSTPVSDAP